MRIAYAALGALSLALLVAGCGDSRAAATAPPNRTAPQAKEPPMTDSDAGVRAPEFPKGLEWLNTAAPVELHKLRGKIVLLDFWTYCCINCMHVIPDLKKLEAKYPNELVVIGVHSGKFDEERDSANIRQAILRYGLVHPVVNDRDYRVWNSYAVRAWPTLVLIQPDGRVAGSLSGEGVFEPLDAAIGALIKRFNDQLDRTPAVFAPEKDRAPATALSFPGKVLADAAGGRLFIADSGHHRIVIVSLKDRSVMETIGGAKAALADGDFRTAAFNDPQGMALDGRDTLYVADTGNHAIRRVDLAARRVTTVAGTGEQARPFPESGPARETALNSPWDLALVDRRLYIAMAGPHQLWMFSLESGRLDLHAGSGREGRVDGPLLTSALAQPSGIALFDGALYFADSEVSSVRRASLEATGAVSTVVGGDLFDFGDKDGLGLEARLQHPIGITAGPDGFLYVADTYNNKVKRVRPDERRLESFLGSGRPGKADGLRGRATFNEPAGLSIAGGTLYIADTNNHAIRTANLETGEVGTMEIKGLK